MHNSKLIERRDRVMISRVLRSIVADLEIQRRDAKRAFNKSLEQIQVGIEVGLDTAISRIKREL